MSLILPIRKRWEVADRHRESQSTRPHLARPAVLVVSGFSVLTMLSPSSLLGHHASVDNTVSLTGSSSSSISIIKNPSSSSSSTAASASTTTTTTMLEDYYCTSYTNSDYTGYQVEPLVYVSFGMTNGTWYSDFNYYNGTAHFPVTLAPFRVRVYTMITGGANGGN